ncbi:MAG: hypothetical protein U0793_29920 [Gemmataceae bacterium]
MKEYWEAYPNGKGIYGVLDDGVVAFFVAAGLGSPVRGTELFMNMMQFFGDEVKAVAGNWFIGHQGSPSINIDKVNELTKQGVVLEEAAKRTWTATRAKKLGFVALSLVEVEGQPGAFTKVRVKIER